MKNIIKNFHNTKVLVIGDIMLDDFLYGHSNRISPEAPVPVVVYDHTKTMLGGAGNVVSNISALGGQSYFIGAAGKDDDGRRLGKLLSNVCVGNTLYKLPDFRTVRKMRIVSNGNHQVTRVDFELPMPDFDPQDIRYLKKMTKQFAKESDIVLLSDYNKGMLTDKTTPMFIDIAHDCGKTVIVDPKGNDWSKYEDADCVKPNWKGFNDACGFSKHIDFKDADFMARMIDGAQDLLFEYNIKNLLVTASDHGMYWITPDGNATHIPAQARDVVDVSGAGDTSLATLGLSIGAGLGYEQSIRMANAASGVVVGKSGTATLTRAELTAALKNQFKKTK